uniref:Uncharacterized protein n=1 Tax=Arundo donax TaxID=35708 RepID=A0A0A9TVR4_ARUDO
MTAMAAAAEAVGEG